MGVSATAKLRMLRVAKRFLRARALTHAFLAPGFASQNLQGRPP